MKLFCKLLSTLKSLEVFKFILVRSNIIFHYATKFQIENERISDAEDFHLSEKQYADFKQYVLEQDFSYSTASEEMLKKMKQTAEEEGFYENSKEEYEALLAKVVPSKERDLDKFEKEIKSFLENEIVSRYYFQKGRAINSFNSDKVFEKGVEILKNKDEYNSILKK